MTDLPPSEDAAMHRAIRGAAVLWQEASGRQPTFADAQEGSDFHTLVVFVARMGGRPERSYREHIIYALNLKADA